MSDRKYRQRGYRDDDRGGPREPSENRPRPPRPPGRPAGVKTDREPRAANVPGFHQTMKCTRCGTEIAGYAAADSTCTKCGVALHSCIQCASFDPGSRWECMQAPPARIEGKDAPNTCPLFDPRVHVERQTGSTREGPVSAKDAFDKLFNF
ncbi:MAG: hypothetical protein AB7I50_07650 [Vicinamibacterales bacterium]